VNFPDFKLLAQLAECLAGSGLHADWAALCCDRSAAEHQAELKHCIDQLLEIGQYQQGLDFVTLVGLPKDSVVIAQVSIIYTGGSQNVGCTASGGGEVVSVRDIFIFNEIWAQNNIYIYIGKHVAWLKYEAYFIV
jgi:hypothetical protein